MSGGMPIAQVVDHLPRRSKSRLIAVGVARSLGVVALTLLGYAMLPVEGISSPRAVAVGAAIGLLAFLGIFFWQLSRVSRAARPVLAAIEAVCLVFGMFVVLFALLYVALSLGSPQSFTEPLDKVSGVYFATTVLTTVGFGDITPVTDVARTLVTVQMVLGMVLIGSAFKAVSVSARQGMTARASASAEPSGD